MNSRGQALIVILGILVIFMITIPAVVYMVQHEGKWTVKQKRTTAAFQSAETGIDRASWRLNESTENWQMIIDGGTLAGYTGEDIYDVYADTNSARLLGQYKVRIGLGPLPGEVMLRSIGKDPDSNEVRTIEVILTKASINSAMDITGGLTWRPNLLVHWGPVVSYTAISSPTRYFPRKFCLSGIGGIDDDPTVPNSDGKEYWAYEPLGTPPQVDLAYYKELAKNSSIPTSSNGGEIRRATGSQPAIADPPGSGYFTSANGAKIRFFGSYTFEDPTKAIYMEGGMDMANGSFLDLEAVVAEGDVDFNAGGLAGYQATVPVNAPIEYVKHKEMNPGWKFPGEGETTWPIPDCGMHGFLYCGGNLSNAGGNSTMCGSVKVVGNVTMNAFNVFYDAGVASKVRLTNSAARQKSWREMRASWENFKSEP